MKCEYCGCEYFDKAITKCEGCGAPLKRDIHAKKIIIIVGAVIISLSAVIGITANISQGDSPDSIVSDEAGSGDAQLRKQLKNAIARNEYGKAVKLCEENYDVIYGNKYFEDELDEIINHFSASAKNYYKAAATYCVIMEVAGYDANTGFEGYDAETKLLDPMVLEEHLPAEDYVAASRTTIRCKTDSQGFMDTFEVTIDICGRTVSYPSKEPML